ICFAITAAQQKQKSIKGKILDSRLFRARLNLVPSALVANYGISLERESPGWRDDAIAPVPECIAVALQRRRRNRNEEIRPFEVRHARGMDVEHHDHGRDLLQ